MGKLFEKQADGSFKPIELEPNDKVKRIAADYQYLKKVVGSPIIAMELLDRAFKS